MATGHCEGYCENCGWPVAAEGVTLTGDDAKPREGAKRKRCDDTACVVPKVFAAIGDDGTGRVVWGLGETRSEALAEARAGLFDDILPGDAPLLKKAQADFDALDVKEITEAQAQVVRDGDVAWPIQESDPLDGFEITNEEDLAAAERAEPMIDEPEEA